MFPHIRTPQGIGDTGQLGGLLPRVQVRAKPENESWDQVQSVVNIYYLSMSMSMSQASVAVSSI